MADSIYFYATLHKHSFIYYDYCVETDFYRLINLDLNWLKSFLVSLLSSFLRKKPKTTHNKKEEIKVQTLT